jgi:uncharacterized membrane protein YjjB (DUF3815 family)
MNLNQQPLVVIAFTVLSSACFTILFRVPRRFFIHATVIGAVGAFCVRLAPSSVHIAYVTLFTSFLVGSLSHLIAKRTGQPAQIFLIPGVIFLVPGSLLYRALRHGLNSDFTSMMTTFQMAAAVTFAISFGLLLANWIVPSRREL